MQTQTFKLAQIAISPEGINELPNKLWPFIWHFIKQGKWPILLLMVLEGIAVGLNSLAPLFYREMVNSFSQPEQMDWNRTLWLFVTMVGTLFVLQPIVS
ncbi:MAG: hypothetical protein EBR79_03980, partial [Proteobacteria bacterium]|nr:hypothetical protein [Pseudomonadota bacterium]